MSYSNTLGHCYASQLSRARYYGITLKNVKENRIIGSKIRAIKNARILHTYEPKQRVCVNGSWIKTGGDSATSLIKLTYTAFVLVSVVIVAIQKSTHFYSMSTVI